MKNPRVLKSEELLPVLEKEAANKGLDIYTFSGKELAKYYNTKHDNVSVVLLAKNKDNAIWNLKNLRKCYLMWTEV